MRYVQSLPPIIEPEPDSGTVGSVARVDAVPRVVERTLPPIIYRQHADMPQVPAINRRVDRYAEGNDRRRISRRVRNEKVLVELRSSIDRRRRKQRREDPTTVIDEKV